MLLVDLFLRIHLSVVNSSSYTSKSMHLPCAKWITLVPHDNLIIIIIIPTLHMEKLRQVRLYHLPTDIIGSRQS